MKLQERITKLERIVLPNQMRLVWADSPDDIPTQDDGQTIYVRWQSDNEHTATN